jgi:hypothetical protein
MTMQSPALGGSQKPGKVQAVAILTLVSGISNILWMLILAFIVFPLIALATIGIGCLLYPLLLLPIILGVFEIIYAAKLLPTPIKPVKPSQSIAVMEVVCALTGNLIPVAAGIVALILYSDAEVKAYFAKYGPPAPVPPTAPAPAPARVEPELPPTVPLPESPVKVAEAIVPASAEPPATVVAMPPVTPAASQAEQPKPVSPVVSEAKPAKPTARPKPAADKPSKAAPKAKTAKPAPAAKTKASKPKPAVKPAGAKTKKSTG